MSQWLHCQSDDQNKEILSSLSFVKWSNREHFEIKPNEKQSLPLLQEASFLLPPPIVSVSCSIFQFPSSFFFPHGLTFVPDELSEKESLEHESCPENMWHLVIIIFIFSSMHKVITFTFFWIQIFLMTWNWDTKSIPRTYRYPGFSKDVRKTSRKLISFYGKSKLLLFRFSPSSFVLLALSFSPSLSLSLSLLLFHVFSLKQIGFIRLSLETID